MEVSFKELDLSAQVLKATVAIFLLALAAAEGAKGIKTDTKQAYLYGNMGDDVVYIRPPDWWPEPIQACCPTLEHLWHAAGRP